MCWTDVWRSTHWSCWTMWVISVHSPCTLCLRYAHVQSRQLLSASRPCCSLAWWAGWRVGSGDLSRHSCKWGGLSSCLVVPMFACVLGFLGTGPCQRFSEMSNCSISYLLDDISCTHSCCKLCPVNDHGMSLVLEVLWNMYWNKYEHCKVGGSFDLCKKKFNNNESTLGWRAELLSMPSGFYWLVEHFWSPVCLKTV